MHRRRRHVGRRVRQRHAAVAADAPARRFRPSPHLPRPRSRSGEELVRAQAHVRPAAFELGRLRQGADLGRRRYFPAHAEGDRAVAANEGGGGCRGGQAVAAGADQGAAEGRGRSFVLRRHRHLHQGGVAEQSRCRRPRQRRGARQWRRGARQGDRRRRQSGHHAARPHRICPRRRIHQHRRDRQFGGRRYVGPRGESENPARLSAAARRADAGGARRTAERHDRRRRDSRAQGQLRPDARPFRGAVARRKGSRRPWPLHARS